MELLYGSCVFVLSCFVVLLTVLIVALMVTLLGRSMFWFTHFHTSICLYGSVAAGKILLIHTLAKNLYYKVSETNTACTRRFLSFWFSLLLFLYSSLASFLRMRSIVSTWTSLSPSQNMRRLDLGDLFFDVSLLLWCCALVFLTQRGLCSAYVPMLMVFFPLATKLLLSRHYAVKGLSRNALPRRTHLQQTAPSGTRHMQTLGNANAVLPLIKLINVLRMLKQFYITVIAEHNHHTTATCKTSLNICMHN